MEIKQLLNSSTIFVHSSDHSGSTWLGYVLGSHSQSAFVGELSRAWTDHARVPCTVCAARGLEACVILHGIEDMEPRVAFEVIEQRSARRVIVENSKNLDWTARFLGQPGRALQVVHVIKDPRGLWASLRRRNPDLALGEALGAWCAQNRRIRAFTLDHRLSGAVVAYDILAAAQAEEVAALCTTLGLPFEAAMLRYWEIEHHGFAANGASSAMIDHQKLANPPKHFATGDDRFYESRRGRTFLDQRWRQELPEAEQAAILADPAVRDLLADLGFRLTPEGIERLAPVAVAATDSRSWFARLRRRVAGRAGLLPAAAE